MQELMNKIATLAIEEYNRAANTHGRAFNSSHESYAVIFEEYEEAQDEAEIFSQAIEYYWREIKSNAVNKESLTAMTNIAIHAAAEWVQVVAMCYKAQK